MNLISVRIITEDVARLVAFYEQLTVVAARWANEEFAELVTANGTLAIGSTRALRQFNGPVAVAAANRSVICEFLVGDVDQEFARVRATADIVQEPTTMPWGNRSVLLRDPDGNPINLFTPQTAEAAARFAR